jgi:hypothetical protein
MPAAPGDEVDRLFWLVARVPASATVHTIRNGDAFCGTTDPLVPQPRLWVDRWRDEAPHAIEPCPACEELVICTRTSGAIASLEVFSGRSPRQGRRVLDRLTELEPPPPTGGVWSYSVQIFRHRFDDGIGDLVVVWRCFDEQLERALQPDQLLAQLVAGVELLAANGSRQQAWARRNHLPAEQLALQLYDMVPGWFERLEAHLLIDRFDQQRLTLLVAYLREVQPLLFEEGHRVTRAKEWKTIRTVAGDALAGLRHPTKRW